jgi:hypothetical protein
MTETTDDRSKRARSAGRRHGAIEAPKQEKMRHILVGEHQRLHNELWLRSSPSRHKDCEPPAR